MEQLDTSPQIRSSPYASPMHNFGSSIDSLTNPDSELYKMEMTFRSMRLDKEGKEIKAGEPLMNELGISSIMGTIQSIVNQVTIMSNLDMNEVKMLIDFLGDTLAKDLMMNREAYGITSNSARDKIYFTALTTSYLTMKRAFEEGDKRFWKGSMQEVVTKIQQENNRGGLLQSLNPFGRK